MIGNESDSWNVIWEFVGVINDNGYIVEVVIFLCIMNFEEGECIKLWGVEFICFYLCEECLRIVNIFWDCNDVCMFCQFGDVKGFE